MTENTTTIVRTDGVEFLRFMQRRWKQLLVITLLSLAITVVFTLLTPKKYTSTGIIFPVYQYSVESFIDNPTFGYDVEADRMLQILQSNTVRDSVIKLHQLEAYYKVDKSDPTWKDLMYEKYNSDIKFTRSPYMSIVITAETEKPELSRDIVNSIIDMIDGLRERIIKANFHEALFSIKHDLDRKKKLVDSLSVVLNETRVRSHSNMMATINSQGFIQIAGGDDSPMTPELHMLLNKFIYEQTRLNDLNARYEKTTQAIERPITKVFQIDRAKAMYKKTSPSMTFNLVIVGFLTLIVAAIVLLFAEKFRELGKKS